MMRTFRFCCVLFFSAAGCASHPQVAVRPSRYLPQHTPTLHPVTGAPAGTVANVRRGEIVKVYGINRYVDPVDQRILHERHAVYRVEQQAAWVTRAQPNQGLVLLGPVLGMKKLEYQPQPLPGETSRDLANARRGAEENAREMKEIQENQAKLTAGVQGLAQQTLEAQRRLTGVLTSMNDRLKKVETQEKPSAEITPAKENASNDEGVVIRGNQQ